LGQSFEKFIEGIRPVQRFPEPQRKGKSKSTDLLAALDGLSALRLISHFQRKSREQDGDTAKPIQDAIGLYSKVALLKPAEEKEESNFRTKARDAISDFRKIFPWESEPENWARRQG
jgi:hypothetical protein